MAPVSIHTGALPSAEGKDGSDLARVIARWQAIAADEFPDNCKALLQMIDETDRLRLWEKNVGGFTFESRDEFLRKKVLIDFDFAEQSLSEIAMRLHSGEEVRLTLRTNGGDRKSEAFNQSRERETEPVSKSDTAAYVLARLDRDRPDLAIQVREGSKSANAAAIEAGFRRRSTPFETLKRAWIKASDDDRAAFLAFIRNA